MKLKMFRFADVDLVIAEDLEGAKKILEEHVDYDTDEDEWIEVPADKEISFTPDPYSGVPSQKKAASAWIKEYGKGFFGSSEW